MLQRGDLGGAWGDADPDADQLRELFAQRHPGHDVRCPLGGGRHGVLPGRRSDSSGLGGCRLRGWSSLHRARHDAADDLADRERRRPRGPAECRSACRPSRLACCGM